jgi:hypothetical protein
LTEIRELKKKLEELHTDPIQGLTTQEAQVHFSLSVIKRLQSSQNTCHFFCLGKIETIWTQQTSRKERYILSFYQLFNISHFSHHSNFSFVIRKLHQKIF